MRNTKPPLLFWQAIVAGDWGQRWNMAALRMPSVIYTMLISAAIGWFVLRITNDVRRACLAACIYLAFLCTFRYGRTYLTSAPETFWLNVPMFFLLLRQLRSAQPHSARNVPISAPSEATTSDERTLGWLAHLGFGFAMGIGLAYKSFALIAPAAATLWCAQVMTLPGLTWRGAFDITIKVALSAVIALGIFALWFVVDPDPNAV
jgi:4-amino-4-deoxy-L-arabinose transferase-like glycosyltransferase